LGIGGYFKGSNVLIAGLAGTGKSTLGAAFAETACKRGERCLFFAFEESPDQVVRNMRSVGIELRPHLKSGLLKFEAARPSLYGFEMHLARIHRDIEQFKPSAIIVDPISAFRGPSTEIHATLVRLADICKTRGITAIFTSLSAVDEQMSESERSVSSLMDTWISLRDIEADGERNRILYLLKSRGMSHSKQIREYELTDDGIHMTEPYLGPEGVLTGAARMAQEAREREAEHDRLEFTEQRKRQISRRRDALERQIAEMRAALDAEEDEVSKLVEHQDTRKASAASDRAAMARKRGGNR
jgi:circadian clock protein KaiC